MQGFACNDWVSCRRKAAFSVQQRTSSCGTGRRTEYLVSHTHERPELRNLPKLRAFCGISSLGSTRTNHGYLHECAVPARACQPQLYKSLRNRNVMSNAAGAEPSYPRVWLIKSEVVQDLVPPATNACATHERCMLFGDFVTRRGINRNSLRRYRFHDEKKKALPLTSLRT